MGEMEKQQESKNEKMEKDKEENKKNGKTEDEQVKKVLPNIITNRRKD